MTYSAIALGHDLGHPPFGHSGEIALAEAMKDHGGFNHAKQSRRVAELLENDYVGLNLTIQVLDGIEKHTFDYKGNHSTRESEVVRIADSIAYCVIDLEDALEAGILSESTHNMLLKKIDMPIDRSEKFGVLVNEFINFNKDRIKDRSVALSFPKEIGKKLKFWWNEIIVEHIHKHPTVERTNQRVKQCVLDLYEYYKTTDGYKEIPEKHRDLEDGFGKEQIICDFIAGMTDYFAMRKHQEVYFPVW